MFFRLAQRQEGYKSHQSQAVKNKLFIISFAPGASYAVFLFARKKESLFACEH